jgi:hypothetical protein
VTIQNKVAIMDYGTIFKLLGFLFWPVLLLFLYYLLDRKGFMRRVDKIRRVDKDKDKN